MNWIKSASAEVRTPNITDDIKEIEFDEMWHFIGLKNKRWIFKAILIMPQEKLGYR